MSTNISFLSMPETAIEDVPPSIMLCSRLTYVDISYSRKLKGINHLPTSIKTLNLSFCDIESITDGIKDLHQLHILIIYGCRRLTSLPELPGSLGSLEAEECESLETVCCPLYTPFAAFNFTNCFKLGQQARRAIIQESFFSGWTLLPGKKIPREFDHRSRGSSLTIRSDGNGSCRGFVVCVVLSPRRELPFFPLSFRCIAQGNLDLVDTEFSIGNNSYSIYRTEHILIFHTGWLDIDLFEVKGEIVFKFSNTYLYLDDFKIIGCGATVFENESIEGNYESESYQVFEDKSIEGSYESESDKGFEDESIEGSYEYGLDQLFEDDNDGIYECEPSNPFEDKVSDNDDHWINELKPSESSQHSDCDTIQDGDRRTNSISYNYVYI